MIDRRKTCSYVLSFLGKRIEKEKSIERSINSRKNRQHIISSAASKHIISNLELIPNRNTYLISYLIQDIGWLVGGIRHKGGEENPNGYLLRELVHCKGQIQASKAMPNKNHLFIWSKRSQKIQQRLSVVMKSMNVLDCLHVDA
jgi:hypothetical protein